jgi:hypothetical protein
MNLLLWNDDADSAAGIKSNDEIEIANAYEKDNELRLGYSGYFRIRKRSGFTQLAELSGNKEWEGKRIHVKSFISRITGNAEGVFRFFISDGAAELECALAANDERCPHFKQGREIAIESGLVENGKIRIDWKTRVLLKRESVITGTLEEIKEVEDKENEAAGEKEGVDKAGKVEIVVSGKTILLEKDAVYKLLGVKPVDGIALSTIINLKKDTMLNKKVVIEI